MKPFNGHTPLPWLQDGRTIYALNDDGYNRMTLHVQPAIKGNGSTPEEQQANADFILHACNSHYDLAAKAALADELARLVRTLFNKFADQCGDGVCMQVASAIDRYDALKERKS